MIVSSDQNASNSIVYTSLDGGKSWKETLEVHVGNLAGDPVCPYGIGDAAYFVVLTTKDPAKLVLYRSENAGVTWTKSWEMPFIDRENLVVDDTGGKYQGRVYINGTGSVPGIESGSKTAVTMFTSRDGGATFQGPALRSSTDQQNVVGMGNTVVLSDGTLVTLFGHQKNTATLEGRENRPNSANSWLRVVRSDDGGDTLSTGTIVSGWFMDRERSQGSHIPWLAVDTKTAAFKDRLYAVWDDARSGRLEVLLSYSSDKGKTWSKPVTVSDDRAAADPEQGPDQIMPLVAVNKDGIVGVAWYDRREHKDNAGWWMRFAASLDGGETFLPSVRVSDAPNSYGANEVWPIGARVSGGGEPVPAAAAARGAEPAGPLAIRVGVNNFFFSPGHTSGFVADAGGAFHPIWADNRTGVSQLWTAAVSVRGDAIKNGARELADLDDVTKNVTMELSDTVFDRPKNTVTMKGRLRNTSKQTVLGPLKARVISLQSDVGTPAIVDSANGLAGTGAIWDFSRSIKDDGLKPDEASTDQELRFRLSDLRPLRDGKRLRFGLVGFDVKILGHIQKDKTSGQ